MQKKTFDKRLIMVILACIIVSSTVAGLLIFKAVKANKFINWKNETIEVELYSDVSVSMTPVRDKDGNSYAIKAEVTQTDGAFVTVLDNVFRADYAGGYKIEYSLVDDGLFAPTKTVTVKIKDSDTPAPYFTNTRLVVFENEEFEIPEYKIALNPKIDVKKEQLTLYRVDGEERTEANVDLSKSKISLDEGNYALHLRVVAENDKSGEAELLFRVRSENERGAIASLNDAYSNSLRVAYYDTQYNLGATYFTSDMYRNEYVSKGSAYIEMPSDLTNAEVGVSSEMSQKEFVEAMSVEGAEISVWFYIEAEEPIALNVTVANTGMEVPSGRWVNARFTAADYDMENNLSEFYHGFANGNRKFMRVYNNTGKAYTLYVDSVYVAHPLEVEFDTVSCNYNEEVTLVATSEKTEDFYYELYDGTGDDRTPQMSRDGKFVPRAAGVLRAMAYPISNRYYTEPIITPVTVKGSISFAFNEIRMQMESGWNNIPRVKSGSSNAQISYLIENAIDDGTSCYAYIQDGKLRMFEGDYILSGEAKVNGIMYSAYTWITGKKAPSKLGDLENFDNPSSKGNVSPSSFFSYVGDYKGASGVIKYNASRNGAWPGFHVLVPQTSKEELFKNYSENDLIAVRVCVANMPKGYYSFSFQNDNGAIENSNHVLAYLGEEWQTLYIPAKKLFENYDEFLTTDTFYFTNNLENHNAEVYIDWMRIIKASSAKPEVTATKAEYQNFNDAYGCMNLPINSTWVLAMEWMESYEGASGVVKMKSSFDDIWPTLKCFQPKLSKQEYIDLGYGEKDHFNIRVYNKNNYEGYTAFHNAYGENIHFATLKPGWNELRLSAKVILDNFEAFQNGSAYIAFTKSDQEASHELYIDSMYFEKSTRSTGIQTEDRADYLDLTEEKNWDWYFAITRGKQFSSYDSSAKAVHYEGSGLWPDFGGFEPIYGKSHYEKFKNDLFVIEMDVDSYSSQWGEIYYPKLYVKADYKDTLCATISHAGKYRIEIPAATILDNWDTFTEGTTSFFYFDDGGGTVSVNANITGMYFAKKVIVESPEYIDFMDVDNWQLNFLTASGQTECTYITSKTLGDTLIKNAIRYQGSGQWPTIGGFNPVGEKSYYEQFREGKFSIEMYVDGYSSEWGEGNYPKMFIKYAGNEYAIANINHTGKYVIKLDAAIILDNWESFVKGTSVFYFDDGGGSVSVDCYFTRIYFGFEEEKIESPEYIDFTDAANWQLNFAVENGQSACSYITSATVGDTLIENAIRYQGSGQWPAIGGFNPVSEKAYYEQYREGKFFIEMYVDGYSSQWGEGYYPKMLVKYPGTETIIANINHTGKYEIKLDAAVVLDNWEAFANNADTFYFDDGGGSVSVDCYFTRMYFGFEEVVVESPEYVDFTDVTNWQLNFATVNGQNACSYVTSTTVGETLIENAIRYQGSGQWPTIAGFKPVSKPEYYEQFREGKFFIEMYVDSYSSQWGEGYYPKMYAKYAGNEPTIADINHEGTYSIALDAAVILDNWDSFVNGSSVFYFDDGGGNVSVDCYFTRMYFGFEEVVVESPEYVDFTDAANWQSSFATVNGQNACSYVASTTVGETLIENAIRYQGSGQWPTIAGFKPVSKLEYYEQFREGKFFIEMYVDSYSSQWGEGYYPKMYAKHAGNEPTIADINHQGTYSIALDAAVILDNWDSFVNGSSVFYFDDGGGSVSVDCYFTRMYFGFEEVVQDTSHYVDFTDVANWQSNFATVNGQNTCSYVASTTVGETLIENAIRYQGSGQWPTIAGFTPVNDVEAYEQYRGGKFVIEMYVAAYSSQWGAEYYPKFYIKPNGVDTEIKAIDHVGAYQIEVPASTILDNWESFVNGSSVFYFDDGGGNVSVDCYFTGMHFTPAASVEDLHYVNFTDAANWQSNFATVNGQNACSYVASTTIGETLIENAIRYQGSGQWPTIAGFNPANVAETYEQYREGKFVIEMYVASYSSQWGAEYYPKFYIKPNGVDTEIQAINHTGVYQIEVPAATVLDNWASFVNGSSVFYFDDGGGNVSVDCYFTGMYFTL